MSGSSNFLQWNPGAVNQENDSAYAADAQRTGGAPVTAEFPSATANKLFYQLSTFVSAFGGMLSAKGYTVSDASLSALEAVLANILTNADVRAGMQVLSYSSTITCNLATYLGFQFTLTGNATIAVSGGTAGDTLTLVVVQDATGGRTLTWPASFQNAPQPDPTPNAVTVMRFVLDASSKFIQQGLSGSSTGTSIGLGIDQTPIGATTPAAGAFTTLSATTPASTENSTKVATTAWAKLGFAASFSSNGYFKFPTWLGGLVIQWGSVSSPANTVNTGSYNIAFPTAALGIVGSVAGSTGTGGGFSCWVIGSTTQFNFYSSNNLTLPSDGANWIAIGH